MGWAMVGIAVFSGVVVSVGVSGLVSAKEREEYFEDPRMLARTLMALLILAAILAFYDIMFTGFFQRDLAEALMLDRERWRSNRGMFAAYLILGVALCAAVALVRLRWRNSRRGKQGGDHG